MKLSDEHQALSFMLMCPAWNSLYKAKVAERVTEYYRTLLLPSSSEAKKDFPDDYLRGAIAALKWAVEWPDKELNAAVLAAHEDEAAARDPDEPLFGGRPAGRGEVMNGSGS